MSHAALSSNGASALDAKPFTAFQAWAVFMAAAMVVLDGLDNQMLGIAAPALIQEWGIAREQLGVIFAFGFVGMFFGTLIVGWLGDRIGRRGALIVGVVIFGLATFLTGFADHIIYIGILKTIAGIGLGGVPGSAASLISELTPARYRSVAVTIGVVCVSIGGIIGGVVATFILPTLGWRWLFFLGGIVPLICVPLIARYLPESPRFLASQPKRAGELKRILTRMGYTDAEIADFRNTPESTTEFVPTRALLQGKLRRDSLALCAAFFSGMFMIYLMYNWAPTLLFANGFPLTTTSAGLTSFNIGGVIGAVIAALVVTRFGSKVFLPLLAIVGALLCTALALLPITDGQNEIILLGGLLALGLSASATQSTMFAVAAYTFPVAVRARGMGLIGAAGRIGAIVSAFSGALLTVGGSMGFFGILAGLMLINALSLAIVRGHVPKLAAVEQKAKAS